MIDVIIPELGRVVRVPPCLTIQSQVASGEIVLFHVELNDGGVFTATSKEKS